MTDPNPAFETRTLPYGPAAIADAARVIAAGGCVAVPTETVYGLAADATDSDAVAGIYSAKGRPSFNPLIVHVLDLAAAQVIATFDDTALALARAFWPGPLTLVLSVNAEADIAAPVTAGLDTIAIRVPAHRAMRALLKACGRPLAAPSANASGAISPTLAAHVVASLGGRIPLVIDDGACPAGLESTIVSTAGGIRILREGPITATTLYSRESGSPGSLAPSTATLGSRVRGSTITAPGQLDSHYAPSKPLRLNATDRQNDEWLIGLGPIPGDDTLSPSGDLTEAAARLFAAFHRADASDRKTIAVVPVPADGIGAAINDRLRRAAHR